MQKTSGALICSVLLFLITAHASAAGEIVLPSNTLSRKGIIPVTYRISGQVTGEGKLTVRWTDALGRVVEDRTIPVSMTDESEFTFPLDLRRAVAMRNDLSVHFSFNGKNLKGPDRREEDAKAIFIARPSNEKWTDYEIIMWQQYPANLQPGLQKLGITGGQYSGRSDTAPEAFVSNNMRWYVENIATDFYAEYHRYRPDRIQNWSFLQAKELWKKDPSSKEAFKRSPSLWDPVWRTRIHERVVASARRFSPYRPFFYSLADESGIADLAAFWDFDFSDQSLTPMRQWLKKQYGTLDALNKEWDASFTTWDSVTPPTTHETMQRKGDNFAAWADFKEWMDISFEEALRMGREAIEEVDPHAYVSIGGGQRPGWGGYDYSRLTKALTAIEPYDIGSNVEIIRSLNPDMPMVSTGFARGPWEQQRVWRALFHGHRGLIIWDEKREYVDTNGQPGPRGIEAAKYYNELRDGIGALIINSKAVNEPIAIHYSQASMRTEWMLARRPEGDAWVNRGAKTERTDDEFLRLRESWCELIEDQGMQGKFVSYDQLEAGELLKRGYRIFILPRSSSLSKGEAEAIREFILVGGTVIADGEPGVFNEHSRRLPSSTLSDLFSRDQRVPFTTKKYGKGKAIFVKADTLPYLTDRLLNKEAATQKMIGDLLRQDVRPDIAVTNAKGNPVVGVECRIFRNGGITLITLMSNPLQRVDELGPSDFRSNQRFEKPVALTVTLPATARVYNVRTGESLGEKNTVQVSLNPYEPIVLASSPTPIPKVQIFAPAEARKGSNVSIGLTTHATPAENHVLHVDVLDPSGARVLQYSGNLIAQHGHTDKVIPFAVNDPSGQWTLRIRDMLTGETQTRTLVLN